MDDDCPLCAGTGWWFDETAGVFVECDCDDGFGVALMEDPE